VFLEKYVSKLGMLREGICTNYLSHKGYLDTGKYAHIAAYVNTNATFRLPKSVETPLLFIAGGCGVAPIRGLLEERVALAQSGQLGPATLYLGFRSPDDEVYRQRFEEAIKVGASTDAQISYSTGSANNSVVSDVVLKNGDRVWKHFEEGGVTFLCGGARSFGAAIESAFLNIVQEHGKKDFVAAEQYLRTMIKNGRLMDDLAD
jgi:sulfite reductase alpha subunit-like flavoprotein